MSPQTEARVAIVTDSAACVPADLLERYAIEVIPYQLIWDGQAFLDGVDITPSEFFRRFRHSDTYPTTAQPTPQSFINVYSRLLEHAGGIVSIHVAEKLTTAVRVARLAAKDVASSQIRIVDTQMAAAAECFVVLGAARAAREGAGLDRVVSVAEGCVARCGLLFTLESLEHLRRGGRIGRAATLFGSRLRIQPILTLRNSQVHAVGVTRSRERAKERILDELERRVGESPIRVSVLHADVPDEATELARDVQQRFHCIEFFVSEFTPVMGAHTGPGIIGVGYCIEPDAT